MDEKSQVQALSQSQPAVPMMPGMPEKRTHDYLRHGTTSLFAAFNTQDGPVISSMHRRHHAVEFKKFLAKLDEQVPDHLQVHLICDNYGTHKTPAINRWLDAHPRFHMHFTPTYSSWINQVERFFGFVTADLLQRSGQRSVRALETDIRKWVKLNRSGVDAASFPVRKDAVMPKTFDPATKERARRMIAEQAAELGSVTKACEVVGAKLGIGKETLRGWARQAQIDAGNRAGATTEEIAQIRDLKT